MNAHHLFIFPGLFGSSCNRVRYTERKICAPKGSSLEISCYYNSDENITSKFWFRPGFSQRWKNSSVPEDLSEDSQYAGRVQVLETERGRSTLRIKELRESDSADYRFKFQSQSFEWKSSQPAPTVSVTGKKWGHRAQSEHCKSSSASFKYCPLTPSCCLCFTLNVVPAFTAQSSRICFHLQVLYRCRWEDSPPTSLLPLQSWGVSAAAVQLILSPTPGSGIEEEKWAGQRPLSTKAGFLLKKKSPVLSKDMKSFSLLQSVS